MRFVECECKKCGCEFKINIKDLEKGHCPNCNTFGYVVVLKIDRNNNFNGEK
ncbi:MAG: hypothetical protein IMZ59_04575 [Actinobacteria bacterium]|nr:hypothetical protein [Actinomycetota bacterium]